MIEYCFSGIFLGLAMLAHADGHLWIGALLFWCFSGQLTTALWKESSGDWKKLFFQQRAIMEIYEARADIERNLNAPTCGPRASQFGSPKQKFLC